MNRPLDRQLTGALRLTALSVLLADAALIAGSIVSVAYGLGDEALPLTTPAGLVQLGRSVEAFTLRETLFLAYPVLLLPQAVALYLLLRERAPVLVWPLVLWCVGLTLGIGIDVFTLGVVRAIGPAYLAAGPDGRVALETLAGSISHAVLVGQFVCDNLSGTLVYPFFAIAAYRAGIISRPLAIVTTVSALAVCVGYRGVNLLVGPDTTWGVVFGQGFGGLIWWDVSTSLKLLQVKGASGAPADAVPI